MADPQAGTGPAFQEAIQYFRDKLRMPSLTWTDLWQGMHARAFVVAGAVKDDLLKDFQAAILSALENGTGLDQFRKDFDRIVAAHGWSYNGGRGWRSRVIYQTNIRMAHSSGKWAQIQRLKSARPYLRYVHVPYEPHPRPEHLAWHNTVLPVDHPWWKTHYPPNGWGCKCTVQSLNERDLKRYNLSVSAEAPAVNMVPRTVNMPSGPVVIEVPAGIDPGFGYNPGEAAYGSTLSEEVMQAWRDAGKDAWKRLTPGDWRSARRPERVPVDASSVVLGKPARDAAGAIDAVKAAIGGDSHVYVLPDGSPVEVDAASLGGHIDPRRAGYMTALPEVLQQPFEVWLSFEQHQGTGKVELRKRLVKAMRIGDTNNYFTAIAQVVRGRLESWTFARSDRPNNMQSWRIGKLLYGRTDENGQGDDEAGK